MDEAFITNRMADGEACPDLSEYCPERFPELAQRIFWEVLEAVEKSSDTA